MARERSNNLTPEAAISIIGPGMTVVGDIMSDGTVRVEGLVEGSITAGKAIVIGRGGAVRGDVRTQDAVIAGTLDGTLLAESRVEVQASAVLNCTVKAMLVQLDEGAVLNGSVEMGEAAIDSARKDKPSLDVPEFAEGKAVPG
jgi:cytoskeletal protein CcmA (bactofilin family)